MMVLGRRGLALWEFYGLFIKNSRLLLGLFSFVSLVFRLMMGPLGFDLWQFLCWRRCRHPLFVRW